MKIDQTVPSLKNVAVTPARVAAKTSANGSASELSSVASQAAAAPLLPSTNGDFNAARVAEIRASISAGSYQVNTEKIADGLLATVRDLLSKGT